MALGCALVWAFSVLLYRRVQRENEQLDPATISLFKNVLATGMLIVTLFAIGTSVDWTRSQTDWVLLGVSGILGLAVGDTLFLAGLRRVDASVAAVADCIYSPTVCLLSALFLSERLTIGIGVGAPLVVFGLLLVGWQPKPKAGFASGRKVDPKGVVLTLLGVFSTAIAVVLAKPALARASLIEATTIRLVFGTGALFIVQVAMGGTRRSLALFRPQPVWRLLVPATILGAYIAMIMWLGGMKYGSLSRAALLNQSGAIMVLIFSRILGETIPARRWAGAALAVAGVCAVLSL